MIRAASICKLSLRLCLCAAGRGSSAAVTVRIPLLGLCVASFSSAQAFLELLSFVSSPFERKFVVQLNEIAWTWVQPLS